MRRVFISHPLYSEGDVAENFTEVDLICRLIMADGYLPISPLHLFGFVDSETKVLRANIMMVCKDLIAMSDEVWSYGDKGGCKIERQWAKELGKPVRDMRIEENIPSNTR